MSVSVVLTNVAEATGEGPHWDERTNCLFHVDIESGNVHRWDSTTGEDSVLHLDDSVSFVIPRRSGGYMVGLGRTISLLDWESGKTTVVAEAALSGTKNRFNDAKCDASGRLWAGTMGRFEIGNIELEKGCLFSLDTNGTFAQHLDKISISNGMAWTDDNTTMYYIDSIPKKVYAFDFDISTGSISNQRVAIDFKEDIEGNPDGCCIDNEGKLWVACYGAGKVIRFDPHTGTALDTIHFPEAKNTTSCCFGGPNLDELYVTSGGLGAISKEIHSQSLAGSVFKVTGLGVKGKAAPIYEA